MNKYKILLINPASSVNVYMGSRVRASMSMIPVLSLASIAGELLKIKHNVKVLDLMLHKKFEITLIEYLKSYEPDIVGVTFTTTLWNEAKMIAKIIKQYNSNILLIAGGVHTTIFPEIVLRESEFDIAVIGEGEETIKELLNNINYIDHIKGIAYKNNGDVFVNEKRKLIEDIDVLEFPAWNLFSPLKRYISSPVISRKNPVGGIETSRGCCFNCIFCDKSVFGKHVRFKKPKRVIEEIKYMLNCGFKEIHIREDMFTSDIDRAKEICNLILKEKLRFPWNIQTGIRVDSIDKEFFVLAKKAGCYSVSFGAESGVQDIINNAKKDIRLYEVENAVKLANEAGLETVCFFMLGLPGENKNTIKETFNFAKKIKPDFAKITITTPFPNTELFNKWNKEGRIISTNWSEYNYHGKKLVYVHPTLSEKELFKAYKKFYRIFYFRKSYITDRLKKSIKDHRFWGNVSVAIKTFKKW